MKSNSVLNDLQNYHVCNPGSAPCKDHDYSEGVIPCDLALCFDYFVNKKRWMRSGLLNFRVNDIQFSNECKQFIPPIKCTNSKKSTATLARTKNIKAKNSRAKKNNCNKAKKNVRKNTLTKNPKKKKKRKKIGRLTGSASQIRRLLMIFPLATYDLIQDYDDDV